MKLLTFNGVPVRVPESWNDLSIKQMQDSFHYSQNQPESWNDFLFRLSTYTGFDLNELQNLKMKDEDFEDISKCLSFEQTALDVKKINSEIPNALKFFDDEDRLTQMIRVPKNLQEHKLGSKVYFMQQIIPFVDKEKSIVPVLDLALSIYFQPLYDNKNFDTDRIREFRDVCKRCKFVDAFPIGNFFFDAVIEINKIEREQLIRIPTNKEIEAGIDEFNQYGIMNMIYQMANGDVTKIETVLNCPWSDVFLFRKIDLHLSVFNERLSKLN